MISIVILLTVLSLMTSNAVGSESHGHSHSSHSQPSRDSPNDSDLMDPGSEDHKTWKYSFPAYTSVELSETNHVTFKGEVNEEMVAKAIVETGRIVSEMEDGEKEVIIYILSPGGSVIAGNNFIQFMNFMRQKGVTFTCVADQAASMAFGVFQECDNRYVTPTSIIMQHQMSVGLQDQYENLKTRIQLLDSINMQFLTRQAARIGLSLEEFKKRIVSDWWLYGEECAKSNTADEVVYVGCSNELLNQTYDEEFEFFGMKFKVVFSKCPLARGPLSFSEVKQDQNGDGEIDEAQICAAREAFTEYLKGDFLKKETVRYYL